MNFSFWISMIVLAAIYLCQIALFFVWMFGRINLSNFFSNKKKVWIFFVPVVGMVAFLCGAAVARINEDFE